MSIRGRSSARPFGPEPRAQRQISRLLPCIQPNQLTPGTSGTAVFSFKLDVFRCALLALLLALLLDLGAGAKHTRLYSCPLSYLQMVTDTGP